MSELELEQIQQVRFYNEKSRIRQIVNMRNYNAAGVETKILKHVSFSTDSFTRCQFLSVLLLQFAKLSGAHQKSARLDKVLMYGVGSVSLVIC